MSMHFTLSVSDTKQNPKNTHYSRVAVISAAEHLKDMACYDHVGAMFAEGYRSLKTFEKSDVSIMDCDNDSDDPKDWVHPEELAILFPGVAYAIVPSRNDGKQKGNKSPRPRFHVYFPHRIFRTAQEETELKRKIYERYPIFDGNALDGARFLFGTEVPYVIWHEGTMTIEEFMEKTRSPFIRAMEEPLALPPDREEEEVPAEEAPPEPSGASISPMSTISTTSDRAEGPISTEKVGSQKREGHPILEGSRNSTLSKVAARIVKRYGVGEDAKRMFWEQSKRCTPPLPVSELSSIWKSAGKFFQKVSREAGYMETEVYEKALGKPSLCPADFSDMGEAKVFYSQVQGKLVYTEATDFMVYDGKQWVESHLGAYGLCQEFLDSQKAESEIAISGYRKKLAAMGVSEAALSKGQCPKRGATPEMKQAFQSYLEVKKYARFVQQRRDYRYIDATMKTVSAMACQDISIFDQQDDLLNTPEGTYDLREGTTGKRPHEAKDFLTKMTTVSPSSDNQALWQEALSTFFQGDGLLMDYVQRQVGMALFGHVYQEALLIAYGDGANGKSTFWNAIIRVLGSYSGSLSADLLTFSCRRNVKPEMAELKGKRLVLASELEEGMRLNTSLVKQLCSTDEILAEKKYRAPFRFTPSHTLVLCTNHLPRIGARDRGTWRRIILIPFRAQLSFQGEKKNYADLLVQKAGGAILTWMLEGARMAKLLDFQIPLPPVVKEVLTTYQEDNDWLMPFLEDCCELDKNYIQPSGTLYTAYRNYCYRQGEYTRKQADFYSALLSVGYERIRNNKGRYIQGVRLKEAYRETSMEMDGDTAF